MYKVGDIVYSISSKLGKGTIIKVDPKCKEYLFYYVKFNITSGWVKKDSIVLYELYNTKLGKLF